jgi:hypothetical protein
MDSGVQPVEYSNANLSVSPTIAATCSLSPSHNDWLIPSSGETAISVSSDDYEDDTPPQDVETWRSPRPYVVCCPVSLAYPAHWKALDKILRDKSDTDVSTLMPLLEIHRPNSGPLSLQWSMTTSSREKEVVLEFTSECHKIAGFFLDANNQLGQLPNFMQMEYIQVLDYVARLVPWMMRSVMDSDLVRLDFLIGQIRDLMISLESLEMVERDARRTALRQCGMSC